MKPGVVVWITGLPSSGKTVLADRVRARLERIGIPHLVLDGDAVRAALSPPPAYTPQARAGFYETLARLAALAAWQGLVVLVPATANRAAFRKRARELAPSYIEVYVATEIAECARRDTKGLYASAGQDVPGVGVHYETPTEPHVVASGGYDEAAVTEVLRLLAGAGSTSEAGHGPPPPPASEPHDRRA